jgi:hypothetical protein
MARHRILRWCYVVTRDAHDVTICRPCCARQHAAPSFPQERSVDGWMVTPQKQVRALCCVCACMRVGDVVHSHSLRAQERYQKVFDTLEKNENGFATAASAKGVLVASGLAFDTLGKIWEVRVCACVRVCVFMLCVHALPHHRTHSVRRL